MAEPFSQTLTKTLQETVPARSFRKNSVKNSDFTDFLTCHESREYAAKAVSLFMKTVKTVKHCFTLNVTPTWQRIHGTRRLVAFLTKQ